MLAACLIASTLGWCESPAPEAPFWLDVQAEDFDGAVHHPGWHTQPSQGWYSMEQRYFSGYAGAICDAQSAGASMTHTLEAPIPPGKHKFFLHLLQMRSGGKNGVRITVGDHSWDVIWSDKSYPVRDYAVDMHELELTKPVGKIAIKCLLVERHNIGDVPSYPIPTIMLDRIQVTNDLRQEPIKGRRRMSPGPVAAPPKPTAQKPVPDEEPIPGGNRLRNGSFEVATTTTWFGDQRYRGSAFLKPVNLVEGEAAHGERCLVYPAEGQDVGRQAWGVFSNVFSGKAGETVPVSLMLRASMPIKTDVYVYNSQRSGPCVLKSVELSTDWQRFSGEAKLPADNRASYYLTISPAIEKGSDARMYVDAVSVGLAPDAEYEPRDLHEAGLASENVGNIHHDKDAVPAILFLANHDQAAWDADLELIVRDHRDVVVARKPIRENVPPSKSVKKTIDVACGRWGIFSAVLHDKATARDLAEVCCTVIPKRDKTTPGMCGLYGQTDHHYTMALMRELGLGWNGTLADGTAQHIVPPEKWDMLDEVLATPRKYGIRTHYCAEILNHKRQEDLHYEGTTGQHAHPPNLTALENDLYEFAKRFKDKVDVWSLMDELAVIKCPVEVWPLYHKVGADAIRKADPDAVIGVSATPEFQEQVLKVLGKKYLDGIIDAGFSPGGGQRSTHRPYARLAKEWDLPLWFSGFGFSTTTYYRTRHADLGYKQLRYFWQVDNTAAGMTVHRLEFAPERFILYSAIPSILWPNQLRPTNIYDTDGSINAVAASYAAIGMFLEDATEGRKLETPHIDLSAFSFKRLGDNWLTFSVDPGELSYGRIQRGQYALELPLSGKVSDSFGNPYEVEARGDSMSVSFEGQPLYVNVGSKTPEEIASAVKQARFTSMVELRAFCTGDEQGGTHLRVVVANNSTQPLNDQLQVSESRDLLPPETALEREVKGLAPGRRASFTFETAKGVVTRRPLCQGNAGATLSQSSISSGFSLWATPSPKVTDAPKMDGEFREWRAKPTAFIHVTKRASGGYGVMQALRGSDRVKDENDIGARISSCWDEANLYLMLRITDDEVTFPTKEEDLGKGDRAVICLDTKLEEDLFDTRISDDDFMIEIGVVDEKPHVSLVNSGGQREALEAAFGRFSSGQDRGWAIEIACPWAKIGVKPAVGQALGFSTTVIDADGSLEDKIEAVWGVFGYGKETPTGYGQLVLR